MTMATTNTPGAQAASAALKAFEDKVKAQLAEGKAQLDLAEAKAKEKKAQAEIAVIGGLQKAKLDIDHRLQDLKTTHETHVARAKAEIDADVAKFKTSVGEIAAKF